MYIGEGKLETHTHLILRSELQYERGVAVACQQRPLLPPLVTVLLRDEIVKRRRVLEELGREGSAQRILVTSVNTMKVRVRPTRAPTPTVLRTYLRF